MKNKSPPEQTSMFGAFAAAEFEHKTAHLPATIEAAIPFLLSLFAQLDAAIRQGEGGAADRIEKEADDLAVRLNGGTHLGMSVDDGAAAQLEAMTRAPDGRIPIWGQQGRFALELASCRVLVEFDGIYGVCFPGFGVHAVDWSRPFLSETGYRSFLGYGGHFAAGVTVEDYARATLEQYIARELKGRLVAIKPEYAERHAEPTP